MLYSHRIPQVSGSGKGEETSSIKPVYVGEFPQVVCDEQARLLQRRVAGEYSRLYQFMVSIF